MKSLFLLLILFVGFSSCKSSRHKKQQVSEKSINGNWELTYISAEDDLFSFEELFPNKKPSIQFNLKENQVSGNTGCNGFFGEMRIENNEIDLTEPMTMTKMLCEGAGEEKFLEMLKKVDTYSISEDNVLALLSGDVAIMRFSKK